MSRESKEALKWCVESALGLIFELTEKIDKKLTMAEMSRELHLHASKFNATKNQVGSTLFELKRSNYIQGDKNDSVVLTNKAKIKIIDKIVEERRGDGKTRLISFDIPEQKRSQRDGFRMVIKRMGFRQIQKSLWASKYNLGDLVESAMVKYGVSDYVAYFVADKSNIDAHIAKVLEDT